MTTTNPTERLEALGASCTAAEAEAFFDSLPAVRPETLTGRYAGRELATGHPMDGLLEASGWYGAPRAGRASGSPLLGQYAIARSAWAVMVSDGLTPRFAVIALPSATCRPGWP